MKCDMYYGIQFAQSLYLMLWQDEKFEEITDRVFIHDDDIEVKYQGLGRVKGTDNVREFFHKVAEKTRDRGNFWRMDMPATQFIEPGKNEDTAIGHWTTVTRVRRTEVSEEKMDYVLGQFTNVFVRENGIWKIKSLSWKKLWKVAEFPLMPDIHLENYQKTPEKWLEKLPELEALSDEGVSPKTREILQLRNEIYGCFYKYNCSKEIGWLENCGNGQAGRGLCDMLDNCRYILATSPVIDMNDSMDFAKAFYSISLLKDKSDSYVDPVRGSIYLELKKEAGKWIPQELNWYPLATIDAWRKAEK